MKKILVVDDSAFARSTLKEVLERAGYEVREASNGYEALEMIPSYKPDLVTFDLLMPDMQGNELLANLQQMIAETPKLVVSADIQMITRKELLDAGASGFLNKPVNEVELLAKVADLLK